MKKKAIFPGAGASASLRLGRLTWIGFLLVAIGWVLLFLSVAIADILIAKAPRFMPPVLHADLIEISRCVIISGFGFAVVGALRSGFEALSRIIGRPAAWPAMDEPRAEPTPMPNVPERVSPAQGKRRPYRIFADGSVEVDTIVGTRVFKSMAEAREFI